MGIVVLGKLEVKDQTCKNQKRHNLGKMGQTIIFIEVTIGVGHSYGSDMNPEAVRPTPGYRSSTCVDWRAEGLMVLVLHHSL